MAASLTTQNNFKETNYFMEKLMSKIFSFYDEQNYIDVTFKLTNPDTFVPAHRLILSAASPYFQNLLNNEHGINPVIEINNVDCDSFERLITHCYTGQTFVTMDNVTQMLKTATILQLDDAIASCVNYLIENISEYTLDRAYTLEQETHCELLQQKIRDYEIENFMEISQSAHFLRFDAAKVQHFVECDNLNVTCEEDVFGAIKRWYQYDIDAREEKLPNLIACLRLTQFDVDFLLTHIQSLPGCELLAFKAFSWISQTSARPKIFLKFTTPRKGVSANCGETTILAVYRGTTNFDTERPRCVLQYNKTEDIWQEYANIKFNCQSYRMIIMDDKILFLGGSRNGQTITDVDSWSLQTKKWKKLPNMNCARRSQCVVALDDKIYVMGGCSDGNEPLQSVERYSTSKGWQLVNSLIMPRHSAGAVCLNGKIFIMGGYGSSDLKSVECYNPSTDTWTPCSNMIECHNLPGVAAHNNHIYVLGDWWHKGNRTVERYDPQRDEWSKLCSLNIGCGGSACVSMEYQLWNIGGSFEFADKDTVTVYDEEYDRWINKTPLPKAGIYTCFVVPIALLAAK